MSRKSSLTLVDRHFASANDIFLHLTIPQVQKLNGEYKGHVSQAKNDLHQLVGRKYRDLIHIAEEIDSMYHVIDDVDSRISDLAYRDSAFVKFDLLNSPSKLDLAERLKKANAAKESQRQTILNYLIHTKLLRFDLQLESDPRSAYLVHFAKIFYTIENVFADILAEDSHISTTFSSIKSHFINHLQHHLASYCPSESLLVNSVHHLTLRDIVPETVQSVLENDDLDVYDDDIDDDHTDDPDVPLYARNLSPILHYLLAYIILNHQNPDLDTLTKVLEKFVELRSSHIEALLKQVDSAYRVRFFKLTKYVENTCSNVHDFFFSKQSELLKTLRQATAVWKPSDVLGFRNWLDTNPVKFNSDIYLSVPAASRDAISDTLWQHALQVIDFVESSFNADSLENQVAVFHNFVVSVARLTVSKKANAADCYLAKLVDGHDSVSKLLEELLTCSEDVIHTHLDALSSIVKRVESEKASSTPQSQPLLFTPELVDLMDNDLLKYIASVRQMSGSTFLAGTELVCEELNSWFTHHLELVALLESGDASSRLAKLLERDHPELDDKLSFGSFDKAHFSSRIASLVQSIDKEYQDRVSKFVSSIVEFTQVSDLDQLYYLLYVLITVKKSISSEVIASKIDVGVRHIYTVIMNQVPKTKTGESSLEEEIKAALSVEGEVSTRPSLQLTSLLLQLTKHILRAETTSLYTRVKLFSDVSVRELFVEAKNAWITKLTADIEPSSPQQHANLAYLSRFGGQKSNEYPGVHEFFEANEILYLPLLLGVE